MVRQAATSHGYSFHVAVLARVSQKTGWSWCSPRPASCENFRLLTSQEVSVVKYLEAWAGDRAMAAPTLGFQGEQVGTEPTGWAPLGKKIQCWHQELNHKHSLFLFIKKACTKINSWDRAPLPLTPATKLRGPHARRAPRARPTPAHAPTTHTDFRGRGTRLICTLTGMYLHMQMRRNLICKWGKYANEEHLDTQKEPSWFAFLAVGFAGFRGAGSVVSSAKHDLAPTGGRPSWLSLGPLPADTHHARFQAVSFPSRGSRDNSWLHAEVVWDSSFLSATLNDELPPPNTHT